MKTPPKTIHLDEDTAPVLVYVLSFVDWDGTIQPFEVDTSILDWRIKVEGVIEDPAAQLTSVGGGIVVDEGRPHICRVQLTSTITAAPGKYRSRLDVTQGGQVVRSVINPVVIGNF